MLRAIQRQISSLKLPSAHPPPAFPFPEQGLQPDFFPAAAIRGGKIASAA